MCFGNTICNILMDRICAITSIMYSLFYLCCIGSYFVFAKQFGDGLSRSSYCNLSVFPFILKSFCLRFLFSFRYHLLPRVSRGPNANDMIQLLRIPITHPSGSFGSIERDILVAFIRASNLLASFFSLCKSTVKHNEKKNVVCIV